MEYTIPLGALAAIVGIVSAITTILSTVIIGFVKGGDALWGKKKDQQPQPPCQPMQCGFEHSKIESKLSNQEDSLKELVRALHAVVNDSNLRHQIVVDKLDRITDLVKNK